MSLAAPYQEHYYVADGVTTSFAFGEDFTALSAANVKCIIYFEDGTNCVPTFTVDMTTGFITIVTLTKPDGTVLTVPPAGSIVRVFRDTPEQQNVTASQLQNYTAKQLERIFDSVVAMIQEVSYSDLHKTIRLTETQRDVSMEQLKEENDQAILYWDFETRQLKATDYGQNQVVKSDTVDRLVYLQPEGKIYFIPKGSNNPIAIGSATIHNDLGGRNAPDCHPESAITNLTTHLQELRDADTALAENVQTALNRSQEAKDTADEAKETAEYAQTVAGEAKDIAEDAKEIAEGIEDVAEEAKDTADEAKEIAQDAKDIADGVVEDIDAIEEKIPAEASSSNQLADKDYVDSQIGDLNEWTTEQYTPTTTNFVVGNTYTVEEAFQRTASLFEGQQGEIDDIEALIPTQATPQNQLADKNFVNATVATNSANFRGNWATWAVVPTDANLYPEDYVGNRTPTNNDYMVVSDASDYRGGYDNVVNLTWKNAVLYGSLNITNITFIDVTSGTTSTLSRTDARAEVRTQVGNIYVKLASGYNPTIYFYSDSGYSIPIQVEYNGNLVTSIRYTGTEERAFTIKYAYGDVSYDGSWRFIYIGTWATDGKNGWKPVYQIGTAFTQEQQAAIDSGITANMVDNYVNPTSTANTAYNKRITALETDKRDIINSANKVYATDANGANKNDLVYATAATADTIAQRGTNGVLKVGTPTDNADATTKLYVDTIASTKQDTLTAGTNITIENNVISSKAQETFFRGRWNNWNAVPTDASLYPVDIHGNHKPLVNDFLVVTDASGYQGDYDNLMSITVRNTGGDAATPGFSYAFIENGSTIKTVNYPQRSYAEVSEVIKEGMYITLNRAGWPMCRVNFYSDAEHTQALQVKYNDNLVSAISSNPPTNGTPITEQFYYANLEQLEGSWRFYYDSNYSWNTDGKLGWKPQYQVEETLPIADSQTLGIAKLYTTTGQNTDGSMTQKSITDALNTKANIADLATVATSGSYNDLSNKPTIPTVNNPTITFTQGGVTKGSFTLNQATGDTIALDAGGGGGSADIDNLTITENADQEIQAVAVIDQNTGIVKTWTGTMAEYEAIVTKDPETEYIITDDIGGSATEIGEITEALNNKVDKGHQVIEFQEPNAGNNYTWYRKYADGWVEQGGKIVVGENPTTTTHTMVLPIAMADTNYNVMVKGMTDDTSSNAVSVQYGNAYYGAVWNAGKTTTGFAYRTRVGGCWEVKGMAA